MGIDILSGRFWANISHTVLAGELRLWKEGELTAVAFKPGLLVGLLLFQYLLIKYSIMIITRSWLLSQ